ncbi:MAG: DUF1963 domain-containing protein [Phycisphaerae bacterium]|nr:DUF1963 domain-containing protein [Phycisphaerae bacterium]
MDRKQAEMRIRESGLARHADVLIRHLAPSARIELAERPADHKDGAAASHFGGLPTLPAGTEWPRWDRGDHLRDQIARMEERLKERPKATALRSIADGLRKSLTEPVAPLAFLGQIDLAEVHVSVSLPGWPRDGKLCFFYDWSLQPWGFDPSERGSCRVIYCACSEFAKALEPPSDVPEGARFPERPIRFVPEWLLPPSLEVSRRRLIDPKDDDYHDLRRQLISGDDDENSPIHRCGGHPQEIQGDMRVKCQLVTNGLYCGNPSGYEDRRAVHLALGAVDWQLVLQIDSDEELGWMWGDCGRLYFWARRPEIAQADFAGAWVVLQCY